MYQSYNPYMEYGLKTSRFSFSNILNTTQRTLNIVNQALPIIKEVKPIVKNARVLFNVAKGFNSISKTNINEENKPIEKRINSNEGLNFFV